jgi:hypothetical protein
MALRVTIRDACNLAGSSTGPSGSSRSPPPSSLPSSWRRAPSPVESYAAATTFTVGQLLCVDDRLMAHPDGERARCGVAGRLRRSFTTSDEKTGACGHQSTGLSRRIGAQRFCGRALSRCRIGPVLRLVVVRQPPRTGLFTLEELSPSGRPAVVHNRSTVGLLFLVPMDRSVICALRVAVRVSGLDSVKLQLKSVGFS